MTSSNNHHNKIDDPLYNSRIISTFVEYMKKHYPDVNIDSILSYAGITNYELEDQGHWFSQRQVDLFYEIISQKTGDPNISRDAGRYAASTEGLGTLKQYTLGLMSPTSVYLLMKKVYTVMSRGATIKTKKLGPNKVEIVSTPKPGVNEKPYQCENRIGTFESVAKLFTGRFATIEHPSCFHKGDHSCRYTITWEKTPSLIWKRIRNYLIFSTPLVCGALYFLISLISWVAMIFLLTLLIMGISFYSEYLEKEELTKTIETQGDAAKGHIEEINTRYNNALLVQEIGQATSTFLDIQKLLKSVMDTMEKRLDFERGGIWLANSEKSRLIYNVGYGYKSEIEDLLRNSDFHLNNTRSRGVVVQAFKQQKSYLVNNIDEIEKNLSKRSLEFVKRTGARSFICVPIVYEGESFGVLLADNLRSKRPLTKSHMSLLIGICSQMAVSIINAMSFKKLQESEERYRTVLEANPDPVVVYDMDGKVTYLNPAFTVVFGWSLEEWVGMKMDRFVPEKNSPETKMMIQKIESGESFSGIETSRYTKKGDIIPVSISGSTYPDRDGNSVGSIVALRDIREHKKLQAQLQRAQKMEAIGTLAGGVAHDLNNILAGLVSYPELLLMDLPEDSPLRKPISTIQRSGEKAAAIVQDLLTLARRGVAITEVVNLNNIISDYLKSPEYEKLQSFYSNVKVKMDLATNLINILGSPVHLSKSIMNLVSNAAEAMGEGGEILISTENRYIDKPIRDYDNVKEGDYITLTVSDTGVGISPEDMEKIFEPFYTKKKMGRSGTGLGMAVVWGTVKDHKGYIDVQSVEGKGTTFTLYFPITRKEIAEDKSLVSIEDYMGKGESILVVDDVEEQREIASQILKKLGYSVTSVSRGEEAVDYMKNNSADLLILDMIMDPGIDGLDTYKKILELHPGQK
ncbi:MAG: PAS domain S-box protein [Deltaproteobacteria bacterium]|nr:PAS domain S-box protein [Deltaproteobacteria bacterium]